MKTIQKISILFILTMLFTSCFLAGVKGDGNVITESRDINSNFTIVEVSQGIDVYLTQGPEVSLKVEIDENLLELILTEVNDNVLSISFKENVGKRTASKIYLSMPVITELQTSSGAEIIGQNALDVTDIDLSASSGAEIKLKLIAENITCSASSGSDIKLSGTCNNLSVDCSSGSDAKLDKLVAKHVKADASSGSDVEVNATESISVDISSGADIEVYGKPAERNIDKSSGGSVSFE